VLGASLLQLLPDAILFFDHDWRITFANEEAQRLSHITPADLGGKTHWELFPETVGTPLEAFYREVMTTGTPGRIEYYHPPFDTWFEIYAVPTAEGMALRYRDNTAEQRSRQNLLDQQSILSFIQKTARIATWEVDLATGEVTFGHGSFPVFGRPLAEIRTLKDLYSFVQPKDLRKLEDSARKAVETRSPIHVDYQMTLPDGERRWLERRGIPIFNSEGTATHLRGMTTDITDRKQNEEMLAASEARYRVLADLNPQALWMGSADGRIVYANQGFLDYIGRSTETLKDGSWRSVVDPADFDHVVSAWMQSMATGSEYLVDVRLIRAIDGASRWWNVRALPVRDEAGAIQQWLGVASDIHESRTAAEALRRQQEETERQRAELETIYETASVGLALFDPIEFRYLRVNDRQAETIGLPKDQIIGHPIAEIAPLKGLKDLFQSAAAGQPIRNHLLEGELPSRPGDHRFWNVSYSPIYDSSGTVSAIAAVVDEVTHQKKSERALIQSEKLAAVGRLASSISHEINNPLEAITNLLFLIALDEQLPESLKGYVHMAQSELGRVSQIVTQTLRFHRQAVNPTSVTAEELVSAVLNLYQGRLANSSIRVQANYVAKTRILCFENDIRQVLNNLIANAIDAMRNGGHLLIRAHDAAHLYPATGLTRRGIRITIADTGHGMSAAVRQRIFEPFYTTKDLNGTGLGLWISAGIIAQHQGHLSLRSTDSPQYHGTIFSLFLPLHP
jgi:PAS domain S-box-containing protein